MLHSGSCRPKQSNKHGPKDPVGLQLRHTRVDVGAEYRGQLVSTRSRPPQKPETSEGPKRLSLLCTLCSDGWNVTGSYET